MMNFQIKYLFLIICCLSDEIGNPNEDTMPKIIVNKHPDIPEEGN